MANCSWWKYIGSEFGIETAILLGFQKREKAVLPGRMC